MGSTTCITDLPEPCDCFICGERRQWNVDGEIVHARAGTYECPVRSSVTTYGGDQIRYYQGKLWVVGYEPRRPSIFTHRAVAVVAFQGTAGLGYRLNNYLT